MSAQILDKDEVVDFISDLIDKRVSETFSKHMLPPPEVNIEQLIDRLHFDIRRGHSHAGYDMLVMDKATGYSKTIPIRGF